MRQGYFVRTECGVIKIKSLSYMPFIEVTNIIILLTHSTQLEQNVGKF
ncbi:hypothetical protein [Arsenophonus endosymbiont of Bemisia tabaci]|nr:hypothetical protein [Arsenophonus endosymbiont of Bemisia tabaci]CAA2930627.1 hypothetical protein ARSQ2_01760 [Arsenophonus endosymbiont of Bemisia tabaci Q2]